MATLTPCEDISIIKRGVKYTLSLINDDESFIYNWKDYCKDIPMFEEVYEDEIGNAYVLYKALGNRIVGEFLNID